MHNVICEGSLPAVNKILDGHELQNLSRNIYCDKTIFIGNMYYTNT